MADNDLALMAHLLRRAGFGAARSELEEYAAKGYEAVVEELLHPEEQPAISDELMYRIFPGYEGALGPPINQADWVFRMVNTKRPLEEKMALFWHQLFATNLFGPVELTKALLPAMRKKGSGRIVVISSQGGIRGMPGISTYSASKGALERWAESMSQEIAPFGLGVTILVTGTFKTEILTEQTPDYGDHNGPYAKVYEGIHTTGREFVDKNAAPPEKFALALSAAIDDDAPIRRRTVGPDAAGLYIMARLLPGNLVHKIIRKAMKLPAQNALKNA